MTPWYAFGDTGEYVLSVVESAIDGSISNQQFVNKLYAIGMSDSEIWDVFCNEVLSV